MMRGAHTKALHILQISALMTAYRNVYEGEMQV